MPHTPRRRTTRAGRALISAALAAVALCAPARATRAQGGPQRDTTPGFVIRDQTVLANCGGCHGADTTGRIKRLSYMRKTPEGWEASVRRMVTLNGVRLDPAAARAIVKYFANNQGLSPAELRPGRFEVERRMIDYRYAADTRTETACKACHSMGRVITQRRTRDEWGLLLAMHRGYYPLADFQGFRRFAPPPPDSAGAGHPMDHAISHLAQAFPLRTSDWAAWSATMRPPQVEGRWLLSGRQPGRGAFHGRLTIARAGADDEFTTRATYRYVKDGAVAAREGRAVVYTGHQWRGRSAETGRGDAADSAWREVMHVEPGWQEMSGRWFRGAYDEFGIDVTLTRLGANPVVAGVFPRALRSGATHDVTIIGANLPRQPQASAVDFGPGVRVERVVRATPDELTVRVRVDSAAAIGGRDLFVAGASLRGGAVVFDRVSRIKVTPLAGMARVGGARFPKQYQAFEAVAYHHGVDGKPDTDDDVELDRVDVTWSLEEYGVTYEDDDVRFVGSIDQRGVFTPALDGPNPQRSQNRNNIGDVWVVATYKPGGADTRTLTARAHLLVTVPLYMRWEPWRAEP
ncbi:MAG: quinohemoprotein amine dehydrogenase subunit alpha [Gemmatimonadaceae bacterium]